MKHFLLILFVTFSSIVCNANNKNVSLESQFTVSAEDISNYKIVSESNGVTIVEITTKEGKVIWNIIAAIATVFLPEIVEGICSITVGDPDACHVAYEVTSALVSISGVRIYRGIARGINYLASRGAYRSFASVEASTYNFASHVKEAFEVYKKYGCVKWDNIGYDNTNNYIQYQKGFITFYTSSPSCTVKVWAHEEYFGQTTKYWYNGVPACGADGTITISAEPGYHKFYIEYGCGYSETNTINIESGKCIRIKY
jgi:hypothetical protein